MLVNSARIRLLSTVPVSSALSKSGRGIEKEKVLSWGTRLQRRELADFNKRLHTLPWTKKAGAPQSGFPLCLPMTAVSFRTQPNSKNITFF